MRRQSWAVGLCCLSWACVGSPRVEHGDARAPDDAGADGGRIDAGDAADGSPADTGPRPGDAAAQEDAGCNAAPAEVCGPDGDVWRTDACGERQALVETCPAAHGSCENGACGCADYWAGADCDRCVVFADPGGPRNGQGERWASALGDLQRAMDVAAARVDARADVERCEVWAAEGTFTPTATAPLQQLPPRVDELPRVPASAWLSFAMRDGVDVYGGFAGHERERDARSIGEHETVLSGEVGDPATTADNSRHVVLAAADALLDGVVIEAGHALHGEATDNANYCGSALLSEGVDLHLRGVELRHNQAHAGALCVRDASVWLEDVILRENEGERVAALHGERVELRRSTLLVASNFGGPAVSLVGSSGEIGYSHFNGNQGGGLLVEASDVTVDEAIFVRNHAPAAGSGSAIHASEASTLRLLNSGFVENGSAQLGGGALAVSDSTLEASLAMFARNVASEGGALRLERALAELSDCAFEENDAEQAGGAIFATTDDDAQASLTIRDSRFTGNHAAAYGGALATGGPLRPNVVRSLFSGNTGGWGGALALGESAGAPAANVVSCRFEANVASQGAGGALACHAPVDVVNGVFWQNEAASHGGAVAAWGTTARVHHGTFHANAAVDAADALSCHGDDDSEGQCALVNSLLWDADPVYAAAANTDAMAGVLSVSHCSAPDVIAGDANVQLEPTFVDAATGDLRIAAGSPTVDQGSAALRLRDVLDLDADGHTNEPVPLDADGGPRVTGAETDLGAHEHGP